jgi:hypothetical protein
LLPFASIVVLASIADRGSRITDREGGWRAVLSFLRIVGDPGGGDDEGLGRRIRLP